MANPILDEALANAAKGKGEAQPKPSAKAKPEAKPKPRASASAAKTAELRTQLVGFYATVGMTLTLVKPDAGEVVAAQAEACADGWIALAEKNPKVRAALEGMMETSAWTQLGIAHLPIAIALMPTGIMPFGAVLPGILGGFRSSNGDAGNSPSAFGEPASPSTPSHVTFDPQGAEVHHDPVVPVDPQNGAAAVVGGPPVE